jgi:hypothetical protein
MWLHMRTLAVVTMSLGVVACSGTQTVDVKITDNEIQMPRIVPSGDVEFRITNAGTRDHSMKVVGSGIEIESSDVPPGETGSLKMAIPPGAGFNVFCEVGDHTAREKGAVVKVNNQ